ncbi:hypothetical protein SAMN04489761_3246 [Tenacibaculum sp. MAR_2009_124]|uniref:hypothetical protein n=1 Tax=Tenacibaculum sp. MAR_2009_124 TaxID=1250059 RepID=UPI0008958CD8|nr:hypothetical protein [Tenacibaculum sp. MAR_2009_124]SEC53164.1 hypothetical protein SAMN04489761_3246 [Tenacibaculum sp. MAR_2009_124]
MFKGSLFNLSLLFLSSVTITFLFKEVIRVDELVYNFYAEQLTQDKVEQLLNGQKKWEWFGYAIIPLVILLRSSLVAICLSIGMFFYNMEHKLKFRQFFRVALLGEFVLVLVGFVKLFYFLFIKTDYTLQDIQQYYPLSYINFLDISNLEPWLIYPLQSINLFEIAYFFVLVYGLHKLLRNNYWKSFEITAASYGTGLIIWIGLVMFLTLNMS